MSRKALIKRLRWYYPLEKIHAFFTFPLVIFYCFLYYPVIYILFVTYGLLVCISILYQGQLYWKLKLYRLTGKQFDQEKLLRQFSLWRKINGYLIKFIPFVFLIWLYLSGWSLKPNRILFWSIAVNIFAVLEYINYYHRQLTIDKISDLKYLLINKRVKTAHLRKDLFNNKI